MARWCRLSSWRLAMCPAKFVPMVREAGWRQRCCLRCLWIIVVIVTGLRCVMHYSLSSTCFVPWSFTISATIGVFQIFRAELSYTCWFLEAQIFVHIMQTKTFYSHAYTRTHIWIKLFQCQYSSFRQNNDCVATICFGVWCQRTVAVLARITISDGALNTLMAVLMGKHSKHFVWHI